MSTKYRATGTDRTTGQPVAKTIEAASPTDAEAIAVRSMVVSKVSPLSAPERISVPSIGNPVGLSGSDLDELAAAARRGGTGMKVPNPASPPQSHAPSYGAIARGAMVLRIFAMLEYLAGLLAVALAVYVGLERPDTPAQSIAIVFVGGLLSLAAGALLSMGAAVGLAIRDMAVNSFRR